MVVDRAVRRHIDVVSLVGIVLAKDLVKTGQPLLDHVLEQDVFIVEHFIANFFLAVGEEGEQTLC